MKHLILTISAYCLLQQVQAQFAPQAGVTGSTAIAASDISIKSWATGCSIQKGYLDIAQPGSGSVTAGDSTFAVGAADNTIVSLGDSGVATLTFAHPVINGPGADFAVFENGFANPSDPEEAFLELAFVEVSSDGVYFFRFPATSFTQTTTQVPGAGVYMNARLINNLAGKYIANYGTPFDLDELSGIAGLDVNHITHVRLTDVVGALNEFASYDQEGRKINDPYTTAFPTGGFDLDAVGVIHQQEATSVKETHDPRTVAVYPNPIADRVLIQSHTAEMLLLSISDLTGKVYVRATISGSQEMSVREWAPGVYFFSFKDEQGNTWTERIVKL